MLAEHKSKNTGIWCVQKLRLSVYWYFLSQFCLKMRHLDSSCLLFIVPFKYESCVISPGRRIAELFIIFIVCHPAVKHYMSGPYPGTMINVSIKTSKNSHGRFLGDFQCSPTYRRMPQSANILMRQYSTLCSQVLLWTSWYTADTRLLFKQALKKC